jgi:hypothetical protein
MSTQPQAEDGPGAGRASRPSNPRRIEESMWSRLHRNWSLGDGARFASAALYRGRVAHQLGRFHGAG